MNGVREELDAEAVMSRYARLPNRIDHNPVECSTCGVKFYMDHGSYDRYLRSLHYDPANQFICDDCVEAAYDAADMHA